MNLEGMVIRISYVAKISKESHTAIARVMLAENAFEVAGIKLFNPDVKNDELFASSLVSDRPLSEVPAESTDPRAKAGNSLLETELISQKTRLEIK